MLTACLQNSRACEKLNYTVIYCLQKRSYFFVNIQNKISFYITHSETTSSLITTSSLHEFLDRLMERRDILRSLILYPPSFRKRKRSRLLYTSQNGRHGEGHWDWTSEACNRLFCKNWTLQPLTTVCCSGADTFSSIRKPNGVVCKSCISQLTAYFC